MNPKQWRGIFACQALATVLVFFGPAAHAQEFCRLEKPAVSGGQISVKISCQAAADERSVRYPAGSLFVGLSLFTLEDAPAGQITTYALRLEDSPTHLPAQEIKRPATSADVLFKVPPGKHTHFLVAVWDHKHTCAGKEGCPSVGYTLGKLDKDDLPVPVDAWPTPACDVAKLKGGGFFAATAKEYLGEKPSAVEDKFPVELETNDCWMQNANWPGRGVSYKRWKLAPVSGN